MDAMKDANQQGGAGAPIMSAKQEAKMRKKIKSSRGGGSGFG